MEEKFTIDKRESTVRGRDIWESRVHMTLSHVRRVGVKRGTTDLKG